MLTHEATVWLPPRVPGGPLTARGSLLDERRQMHLVGTEMWPVALEGVAADAAAARAEALDSLPRHTAKLGLLHGVENRWDRDLVENSREARVVFVV